MNNHYDAHLGGEQFVAIVFGSSPMKADVTRKRVGQYCKYYNQTSDKPYKLSISTGSLYFNPEFHVEFEEL